jgi:prepilin-type N-terminal cleavage/methylation domain-containing protein/prepilin-type processing-associated H-X9-DG protein
MRKPLVGPCRAFTLVELLVVITIIGILIALLLPAVQAAREAARIAECQNHVKQFALGCLGHESATGRFPTGGWGWAWTGDPDRGTDWHQPGGWIYNVLPYIDQTTLHDLGAGLPPNSAAKLDAATQCAATPLAILHCPTRRPPVVYPWPAQSWFTFRPGNMNRPVGGISRNDYAACGGDYYTYPYWPHPIQAPYSGPRDTSYVDGPQYHDAQDVASMQQNPGGYPYPPSQASGVCYCLSMIGAKDVTDGLSTTYLLGEKYANPDYYMTGEMSADNDWAMAGYDFMMVRFVNLFPWWGDPAVVAIPRQDTPGFNPGYNFGSAHPVTFNMAMCDGSVSALSYGIDLMTHVHLANRHDGQAIDPKQL